MESSRVLPREDLASFLEQPANPDRIVSLLLNEAIHRRLEHLLDDRKLTFGIDDLGVTITLEDHRPGGASGTLQEFEERLIRYQSDGYQEVDRGGEAPTGELECHECLAIMDPDSLSCRSCGSNRLDGATIPSTLTLIQRVVPAGRTNEELLDLIWRESSFLTTGDPE